MKKLIALLLAMLLVFSFAACGNNEEQQPTEPATEAPTAAPTEPVEQVHSMSMVLQESADSMKMLSISDNGDGTVYVEMRGDVIKMSNLDASVMQTVSQTLENSGLKAFSGQEISGENMDISCSMYIDCGEEAIYMVDIFGVIPEDFATGYAAMESCIAELLKDVAEYVPAPVVMGEIAESDMNALNAILEGMVLEVPDAFGITGITTDDPEVFSYSTGLPSTDGVASAVSFAPNMNASAYSLVIVTLAEGADSAAIATAFEENIDWLKWICVQPQSAAIATKDNQVLCLLGSDEIFAQTITAIDAAGWMPVANLENPNLEG